jgi:hypothetical protein
MGTGPASGTVGVTPAITNTFIAPSATGTGNITATFVGGGGTCSFATASYINVAGDPGSPPGGTAPPGYTFPHGLFDFTLTGCTAGSTVTFTITYPTALPGGTLYWKYGPRPGPIAAAWYVMPATVGATTITFSITDGGVGDDDLAANGTIVDQGGPGFPPIGGLPGGGVPTLSEWAQLILGALLLLFGMRRLRAARR